MLLLARSLMRRGGGGSYLLSGQLDLRSALERGPFRPKEDILEVELRLVNDGWHTLSID